MKFAKKISLVVLAVVLLSLVACGGKEAENTVTYYKMDGMFNSEETNLWRNLYLVDEDTYILEIEALNSDGSGKITVEYVERGTYLMSEDGTQITLRDGYGSGYVMDEDSKIDWTGKGMDTLLRVNGVRTFLLNEDGTWEPVE